MKVRYNDIFLEHDTGMFPENRKRLENLKLKSGKVSNGEKYLELIHTKKYIKHVKEACKRSEALDFDTITSKRSYEAAIYAVGATIDASESGDFAIVRPPGHHAHPEKSSGFCIFNNLAISVQRLVERGKRVLIFDFDGHLGDGTEEIFYNTNEVMYFSIHQYPAFPHKGWVDEIGRGKGEGYTLNVPLPKGSADDLFLDGIKQMIPIMKKFKPDFVAVSAGFDAYQGDLLLELNVSLNSFYKVGKLLKKNFNNVYATLEGGYNVLALPYCVANFLDGFNGKKQRFKEKNTKSSRAVVKEYEKRMKEVRKNLEKKWELKKTG